jgi:type VI secretion system protein ImpH
MGLVGSMTTTDTPAGRLLDRLLTRGWEFDFFQAVWLLERYVGGRTPVGNRGPVGEEAFRFRPDVSVGFPATDVRRITRRTYPGGERSYYEMEVTFMGLYGVSTPLPLHYAVDILRAVEQSDALPTTADGAPSTPDGMPQPGAGSTPVRDFLDLFHHRLVSLFYRTWLKYRYDKSFGMADRDVITEYLLLLIGCSSAYDEETLGVHPIRLLRYAGTLTQRPRSGVTLEGMLTDYWKSLPFQVQECVGRWVLIPPADRNRIGQTNSTPGLDLAAGEQVYDLAGAFNVTVGPMDWPTYLSFLPGERRFCETCALVKHYCVDPLWFTIELKLQADEVPELRLSCDDDAGRLGFTSWVRTREMPATSATFEASSTFASRVPRESSGQATQDKAA